MIWRVISWALSKIMAKTHSGQIGVESLLKDWLRGLLLRRLRRRKRKSRIKVWFEIIIFHLFQKGIMDLEHYISFFKR